MITATPKADIANTKANHKLLQIKIEQQAKSNT
jgi:hypothetical protein